MTRARVRRPIAAEPGPLPRSPAPRRPSPLLTVQRRAGNRAAVALAARQTPISPSPTSALVSRVVAQVGAAGGELDDATARTIEGERRRGTPLAGKIRGRMEAAFGSDFGDVRIHTDATAAALSQRIQARAFTIGADVFVADRAGSALDSTSGHELLAHELTHVVQQTGRASSQAVGRSPGDVGRRVQRKGEHFWRYVTKHVTALDPANNQTHKDALIAGWLLDQNIYDLQALLSSDQQVELLNAQSVAKQGFTAADAVAFLRSAGAPGPHQPADVYTEFLSNVIGTMPQKLTGYVSGEATAAGRAAVSEIKWTGLLPWGAGRGVMLRMQPGGIPAGSGPDSEPVWMKTVEQHHPSTNGTTTYVRGHLLNDNIGGPGLDYNMVPITGKQAPKVGGNDANGQHLVAIEKAAKDTWNAVAGGRLATALYAVEPKYGRTARAETGQVRAAERAMRAALDGAKAIAVGRLQALTAVQLQQVWMNKTAGQVPKGYNPSSTEMVQMLAQAEVSAAEKQTVADLRTAANVVMAAIDAAVDSGLLDASAEGDAGSKTLGHLYYLLTGNAETWEAEERYVPTAITVALETVALDGTKAAIGPLDVPVKLPNDIPKLYFRPKKKAEIA